MIEYSQDGTLGRLTIQRPEKKNAFTCAMWGQLLAHCNALADQVTQRDVDAPRVLLLQGQPGAFCAGADIIEMAALVRDAAALAANNAVVTAAQIALQQLPLPTIAVIDGPCFGGGFGLAAACDFRLGSTRSSFAITPAKLGLLYSLEDTRRVLALVGAQRARWLLLRGERLDPVTALDWGVLDALVAPEALAVLALSWADGLAAQSATSMAGIKATVGHLLGLGTHSEAQVRKAFDAAFMGADFEEGRSAFLDRRAPKFSA
jgi:enoyl-CoA hydratase